MISDTLIGCPAGSRRFRDASGDTGNGLQENPSRGPSVKCRTQNGGTVVGVREYRNSRATWSASRIRRYSEPGPGRTAKTSNVWQVFDAIG
jgi:hypothetical protein